MNKISSRLIFVIAGVVLTVLTLWAIVPIHQTEARETLRLDAPLMISQSPSASFLNDEAGITAYTYVSQTIRLDYIKSAFRTIEAQTSDYIIGSVAVPGYEIGYDAHVYAHTDGWIVAYYDPSMPISRILDWKNRTLETTTLAIAISKVAERDGITMSGVNYYDFRYPNATEMLWVKKNSGTFQINIPSSYEIYERSWVIGIYGYSGTNVKYELNNVTLASFTSSGWASERGTLSEAELLPDFLHTFRVSVRLADSFTALVLVY